MPESSRISIWNSYRTRLKFTQNLKNYDFFHMRLFETCADIQLVFTCFAVTNTN